MALTITIRASDTDDVGTATQITLEALGVKPFFLDEGEAKTYSGGRYTRIKKSRLAFDIVLHDFLTIPHATWQDSRAYVELITLLSKRHLWIYDLGDEFVRVKDGTSGLVASGAFALPIKVEVYSWGDFAETFDEATNQLTGLVLADLDLYTF